jgi:hypothetical protein
MLGFNDKVSNVKTFTPQANLPVQNKDVSQIKAVSQPIVNTGSVGVPTNTTAQTDVDKDYENAPTCLPPKKIPSVFGNAIRYPVSPKPITTTPVGTFWSDAQRENQMNKYQNKSSFVMKRQMKNIEAIDVMTNKEYNYSAYDVKGIMNNAKEMRQSAYQSSRTGGSNFQGYKPNKNSTSLTGNVEDEVPLSSNRWIYLVIIAAIGVGAYIYVTKYKGK